MKCKCGHDSRVDVKYSDTRRPIDQQMGTYTRRRFCLGCGADWKTVEVDASELADLRRAAAAAGLEAASRTRRAVRSGPLPFKEEGRIGRAAVLLQSRGDVSLEQYRQLLSGLCETKEQMRDLSKELGRHGLIKRDVRVKWAAA